jgi:hypothetical protein
MLSLVLSKGKQFATGEISSRVERVAVANGYSFIIVAKSASVKIARSTAAIEESFILCVVARSRRLKSR